MKLDRFELLKSVRKGQRRPTMIEEGQRGKIKYNRKDKYKKDHNHDED
jgi:hypothetical protein